MAAHFRQEWVGVDIDSFAGDKKRIELSKLLVVQGGLKRAADFASEALESGRDARETSVCIFALLGVVVLGGVVVAGLLDVTSTDCCGELVSRGREKRLAAGTVIVDGAEQLVSEDGIRCNSVLDRRADGCRETRRGGRGALGDVNARDLADGRSCI